MLRIIIIDKLTCLEANKKTVGLYINDLKERKHENMWSLIKQLLFTEL